MDTRSRALAFAALALGAVALGFAPILVRLTETGPASAGFWRMVLALPVLAAFAFRPTALGPARPPDRALMAAGVFFALDLAFWHYGIHYTSVANATVLANLTPIVVTAAGWIFLSERPARSFLAGLALGAMGAVMMAMAGGQRSPGINPPLGDTLSVATTFWYAAYFLFVRQARRSHGTMAVMFWSTVSAAAVLPLAMVAMGEDMWPDGPAGWAACAGLALVHVIGQGAIAWALGRLPTATAAVVLFVQPVVAAVLAWMLFSEAITPLQALGAALALAGVALAQWAASRPQRKRAPVHS